MITLLLYITFFIAFNSVTGNHVECVYKKNDWFTIHGYPYMCQVEKLVIDSRKNSLVAFAAGKHLSHYDHKDVTAFRADHKTVNYFPRSLDGLFPNIKMIYIHFSGLKQVTKDDLKSLENLVSLDLWGNEIQTIPENLFEFNPNIKHISFTDNKITFIHPQVFNKLDGLVNLFLDKTRNFDWEPCDNIRIEGDRNAIKKAIKELNPKCYEQN